MIQTAAIPRQELGKGTSARIVVLPDAETMQQAFVDDVVGLLRRHNAAGRNLVVIFPVGPVQFRPLAVCLNQEKVDLRQFFVFFMDEFCDESGELVPETHPMSLRGFARREFLDLLDPVLGFGPANVCLPDPHDTAAYASRLAEVGGADVVYTGFGINGHWAFNEPDETGDLSVDAFAQLPVRRVKLSVATTVQTAMGGTGGDLLGVPPMAVTVGMRELLSARSVHGYFPRYWHSAIVRRALHGPVTPSFPGSYIQRHPDVTLTMPAYVADLPEVIVTQKL